MADLHAVGKSRHCMIVIKLLLENAIHCSVDIKCLLKGIMIECCSITRPAVSTMDVLYYFYII